MKKCCFLLVIFLFLFFGVCSAADFIDFGDVYKLVKTYKEQGDNNKIIEILKEFIKGNSELPEPHIILSEIYLEQKRYLEAIKEMKKLLELEIDNVSIRNNLGYAYGEIGQYDKAIEQYEISLSSDSTQATLYNNLGAAYATCGQVQDAGKAWERALEIEPDMEMAKNNLELLKNTDGEWSNGRTTDSGSVR